MEDLMRNKPAAADLPSLRAGIFRPLATYFPTPKPAETLRVAQKACALWEQLVRQHPTVAGFKNDLAIFHLIVAIVQARGMQFAEAAQSSRQVRDLARQAISANPNAQHHRVALVLGLGWLQPVAAELGLVQEAEEADRQALAEARKLVADYPTVASYQELLAWTWECLGCGRYTLGQSRQEEEAWRGVLACFEKLVKAHPTVPRVQRGLLGARTELGELLWSSGRKEEATEAFRQLLRSADAQPPTTPDGCSSLAYFLATCPDLQCRDGRRAVELARKAVEQNPTIGRFWHTLGVAHYRAGDAKAAVNALTRSSQGADPDAYDSFFLAMSHWQVGDQMQARRWFDRGAQWMAKTRLPRNDLRRLRAEAEQLLGITTTTKGK
jgi:tetratricopeptide (TPR) repeat protein